MWRLLLDLFGALGVIATIGAISWACFQRIALKELISSVRALGDQRLTRPIQSNVTGPVGELVTLFNKVAPQLEQKMVQLERDRQQLQAVLSGMAEGVIAIDARRRLLFANAEASTLFRLDETGVGRLVAELIRNPQVQDAVEATLTSPGGYQGEVTFIGRESPPRSSTRVLALHGTPLPGSPAPGGVLVFHDVTELRHLERMRQDFVANVSHELKTPLASIKAYTETLLDWGLDDPAVNVRFLKRIEEQAERLNLLIMDLLSLARIEAGQDTFRHEPLQLAGVVHARIEDARPRAEAKGLTFSIELDELDDTVLVIADEEAVRQILDNLLDNAVKYTPENKSVAVRCRLTADAVLLEVADTGIGIPRDDLPRIFERFYRVDKARSRAMGGTGLGLSIVKHLVQSIGGKLTVDSRVGSGTTFGIELPRVARGSTS